MSEFNTPSPPPISLATVVQRPRPKVAIAAVVVLGGGALMTLGSFLTWLDFDQLSFNGFTTGLDSFTNVNGVFFLVSGLIVVGCGGGQLAANKILALGIVGIATSAIGLLIGLKVLGDVTDLVDLFTALGADAATGVGLYVVIAGAIAALGGSIATVAKPRA